MASLEWKGIDNLPSRSYTCGYCGIPLASEKGWRGLVGNTVVANIRVCHRCGGPTYFDHADNQTPGVLYGGQFDGISDVSVAQLYEEARKATGTGSYTAAVLCCRKLLMHIAVSKGAKEGQSFVYYVEFLSDNHYVPPDAKGWVDQIRKTGNEANHEIVIMKPETAKQLLAFVEMLLRIIYEFPASIQKM